MSSPPRQPPIGDKSQLGKAFQQLDLEGHNLPPSPAPSSPRTGRRYALATELVYTEHGDQYNSSSMPIYQVRFSFILLYSSDEYKAYISFLITLRRPHSSNSQVQEEASMITQDLAILHGHIWKNTWRKL